MLETQTRNEQQIFMKSISGVSIKYDRQTAQISKLVVQLALIVLLIWIMSKVKINMSGMGMDSLVNVLGDVQCEQFTHKNALICRKGKQNSL